MLGTAPPWSAPMHLATSSSTSTAATMWNPVQIGTLVVALSALALSIAVAWYVARHLARRQRLATFERLHASLIDVRAAHGRKLLFLSAEATDFPRPQDPEWDEINYALALYDTLGGYLDLGLVDRDVVVAFWYHPIMSISGPIGRFMVHRQVLGVDEPWAYLWKLMAIMQTVRCTCPTCRSPAFTTDDQK